MVLRKMCQSYREADAEDPSQATLSFAPVSAAKQQAHSRGVPLSRLTSSSGKGRHSYFRARKLQRVVAPI